jgi:glutaredoxin
MMELVLENEQAEFLSYFPELSPYVTPIEVALSELEIEVEQMWIDHKYKRDQKEFALAVKDSRCAPVLFAHKKVSGTFAMHSFHSMDLNRRVKLLEKYVNQ